MSYCKTSSTEIGSFIFYQDKDIRQIVTVLHYHHYPKRDIQNVAILYDIFFLKIFKLIVHEIQ